MDSAIDLGCLPVDDTSPFGVYAPSGWRKWLLAVARFPLVSRGAVRKALTDLFFRLQDGAPVDMNNDGFRLRLYPSGDVEKRMVSKMKRYDRMERKAMETHLVPGDTWVDIGAHAGFYTFYAARRVGTEGCVVSVEPHPAYYRRLAFNLALNSLHQVHQVQTAAGEKNADAALHFRNHEASGATLLDSRYTEGKQGAYGAPITVAMRPLLDIVRQVGCARIDGLKIDVEGYEDRVLAPFFAEAPQALWPRLVIIEVNATWKTDCLALLEGHGYRETFKASLNRGYMRIA